MIPRSSVEEFVNTNASRVAGLLILGIVLPACGVGGSGTLTPTVAPQIPASVSALAGNRRVTIRWMSQASGATFTVKRSLTSGGPYFPVSTPDGFSSPTSYVDTGLLNGTSYFYVVNASNAFGLSADSEEVRGTPGFNVLTVGAGSSSHRSLFVLQDRTLWVCGSNGSGALGVGTNISQASSPIQVNLSNVVAAASGANHSLALLDDGTVWAWGDNGQGQLGLGPSTFFSLVPLPVPGLSGFIAIAAGWDFTLALKNDGSVWTWGANAKGQLGNGSAGATPLPTPTMVPGLPEIVAITAGEDHAFALAKNGMVWSWGNNEAGQLGQDPLAASIVPTPAKVYNLTGIISIAAGRHHGVAARNDGSIWIWGDNNFGYLGVPSPIKIPQPIQIPIAGQAAAVAASSTTSYLVRTDGFVMAWGNNVQAQCGLGHLNPVPGPTVIPLLTSVTAIYGGLVHALALRDDGSVAAWGQNSSGEVGIGQGTDHDQPIQVPLTDITKVSAGQVHTVALRTDGTVWTWGNNQYGQMGNGTSGINTGSATPYKIPSLTGMTAVCTTLQNTYAIKSDGTVWAWGANNFGQLGQNSTSGTPATSPVKVLNLSGIFTAVAGGYGFAVALRSDGTVWCWGLNTSGQMGSGATSPTPTLIPTQVLNLSGVTAIAAGVSHALALSGGEVWAWGANVQGAVGNGSADGTLVPAATKVLTGVDSISAGWRLSLAVKSDKTLWGWGARDAGQMGDGVTLDDGVLTPTLLSTFAPAGNVAAGTNHVLGVKTDGSFWAWGSGLIGTGLLGIAATPLPVVGITNPTAISAGDQHSMAILPDGSLWSWGSNSQGQLGVPLASAVLLPTIIQQ
jgi:alpha-tubulin suppressor-like RCC1 family protein